MKAEIAVVAGIIAIIGLIIFLEIKEQREWSQFVVDQNCKVVGRERGSTNVGYGVTTSGQMGAVFTTTASKTGWLCDDGVTYWR